MLGMCLLEATKQLQAMTTGRRRRCGARRRPGRGRREPPRTRCSRRPPPPAVASGSPAQRSTSSTDDGLGAAVLAGHEVGGDDVVGRERLEPGHGDPHLVHPPAELVRRARVPAPARPVRELVVEHARGGERLPRQAHVLLEFLEHGGVALPSEEVLRIDAHILRGALDRGRLVQQFAGEVPDLERAHQRPRAIGRVHARRHHRPAGGQGRAARAT